MLGTQYFFNNSDKELLFKVNVEAILTQTVKKSTENQNNGSTNSWFNHSSNFVNLFHI